jgi:Putative lumazine-binding
MQSKSLDNDAIYEAVSDYYGGWYEANANRMDRCLHPGLAKRAIKIDDTGKEFLRHLTKDMMVEETRKGGGSDAPPEKKNWTITILDSYEEIATVKVASGEYMEYIHLAKQEGRWLILNVLWTDHRENR